MGVHGEQGVVVSETQVFVEKRPGGASRRTCSGKCGDVAVGPIDCPTGSSPVLDCTSNPPRLWCLPHDAPSPFGVELDRVADAVYGKLKLRLGGAGLASTNKVTGVARILGDDCSEFKFEVNGNVYKFNKTGKDSWVETVKYSKRNNTQITVEDNGITNSDHSLVPTEIYDA